jgi:thiosulfate sulfurtransferase
VVLLDAQQTTPGMQQNMAFERISKEQALSLIDTENAVVIDIRDVASFQTGHIDSAINVDNNNVQSFIGGADKEVPLIVCCYHGNMSQGAADFFGQQGFTRSCSLDGGYAQWAQEKSS